MQVIHSSAFTVTRGVVTERYMFIQASPLPYLKGVAVPFSLTVGIGIGIGIGIAVYAVWLNPRNKTRQ